AALTGAPAIVTLGAQGALLAQGEAVVRVAAPPDVEAGDSTGAGDTVVGAFAAELARGVSLEEAVRLAGRAAAISVTGAGAPEGMPNRVQLQHNLKEIGA